MIQNGVARRYRARRRLRSLSLLLVAVLVALVGNASAAQAASHQLIEGDGSSWAYNALNVWIANVTSSGLQVVFTSTGSGTGRKDFGNATNDFAVSDIGYQGKDPQTGDVDLPCKLGSSNNCRAYAYLPIVAGGTAFPYHLVFGGQQVTNLRLSGQTLAKIFTGGITNWDDPEIEADNHRSTPFPSLPIIPINHAEPSGSSAQFTLYLDSVYPSIWRGYTGKRGETEYFPRPPNGKQLTGSDGVIDYITSSAGNGSIGYDEYSYALAKQWPVAEVENAAGYFTLPTQYNVAVALQKAQINMQPSSPNYLLQKLDAVYRYTDPRTYPLSSYSYMIIPTSSTDARMNTAKRQTLADFIYYSVCDGQGQVGPIGYSSLPLNLVQASFNQVAKLKTADPGVDLSSRNVTSCHNPTFVPGNLSANHLAQIAPYPRSCDSVNSVPCDAAADSGISGVPTSGPSVAASSIAPTQSNDNAAPAGGSPVTANSGSPPGARHPGASQGARQNNAPAQRSGGATDAPGGGVSPAAGAPASVAPAGSPTANVAVVVNPVTGQTSTVSNAAPSGGSDPQAAAAPVPDALAADRQKGLNGVLGPLALLLLLVAIGLPPVVYYALSDRRRKS